MIIVPRICERHFQNYHDVNSASKNAGSISRDFLGHFPEIKQLIESIAK